MRATKDQIAALNLKDKPTTEEYLFVVNSSGLDTIDEILQARTALFQRVYFHAVTRTAERLLSFALEANADDARPALELTDGLKLWTHKDATILDHLVKSDLDIVKQPATQILNRQFPKKAYSFSPAIAGLQIPIHDILPLADERSVTEIQKQVSNTTIETHLRDEHLWKGKSKGIEDDIRKEALGILRSLKNAGKAEVIPIGKNRIEPRSLFIVGTAHEKQKRHNQIICQNDRLLTLRDYTNAREQQDAYELLKEVGFVLCDEEWRAIVFFAARIVLARIQNNLLSVELKFKNGRTSVPSEEVHYITRFLPEYSLSALRSGLPARTISRLANALNDTGYFDDKPWAFEPESADSRNASAIADQLRGFDGYRSWRVTPKSVSAFLSQFPPSLRDSMAEILITNLKVIDTQTVVGLLSPMLQEIDRPIDVLPFSPSSGAQIHTWLKKEIGSQQPTIHFSVELKEALEIESDSPIIFVDDNSSSGVQARAQLLNFLNIPRDQWPEECRDEDNLYSPLDPLLISKFRQRDIYLYVCVGHPKAEETIRSCLLAAGFDRFKGLRYAQEIDNGTMWPDSLRTFLNDVGRDLLSWTRHRKQFSDLSTIEQSECERHAFGYHNAGGLLTTLLSVPTGTITPLWLPGLYRKQPWMPLVLRTNKLRHLVIG